MIRPRPALAVSLLLAAALPAGAEQLYQWTDADGVTHYADAPPAKGDFRAREVAVPAPAATAPVATPAPTPAANANADACGQARLNLERLRSDATAGPDADGDGRPDAPLTDAERADYVAMAQRAIDARCPDAAAPPMP